MAVLEQVIQLQSQGLSDTDIIKKLRDNGENPSEINDALTQVKIKSAVSHQEAPEQPYNNDMQQSIMQEEENIPTEEFSLPQEQQYLEQPQYNSEQAYYPQQPQIDTETFSEIAEQVVAEKFKEFEQKTGDLLLFKNSMQEKVADLNERLTRIEKSLDKIQQAIICKIGEFGENVSYIHKDLDSLHNTVSKLMNPLIDNYQALKKISEKN
mgnify:CR=1 FL=1